jgi:hypothetical protein
LICFSAENDLPADEPQVQRVQNEWTEASDMLNEEEMQPNDEDVYEDDSSLLRLPVAQRQLYLRIKRNQRQVEDELNRNEEAVTAGNSGELFLSILIFRPHHFKLKYVFARNQSIIYHAVNASRHWHYIFKKLLNLCRCNYRISSKASALASSETHRQYLWLSMLAVFQLNVTGH